MGGITFIKNYGRLCNVIFRSIPVSIIAENQDLKVEYDPKYYNSINNELGLNLYSGSINPEPFKKLVLKESTFENVYKTSKKEKINLHQVNCFMQDEPCASYTFNFLRRDDNKKRTIEYNPFKNRYKSNNDIYIHIRWGDVSGRNPGYDYYLESIKRIENFDNIYISSDTKNNVIIEKLKKTYPKIKTLDTLNDIKTIQFGSTCKHVILSHGSYSAIIGYLSFFSDVYFCDVPNNYWCPMGMLKNKGFNGVIVKSATDKFNEMKKK